MSFFESGKKMKRYHKNIRVFDNGNIALCFSPEQIKDLESGKESALEIINKLLKEIDCYFKGGSYWIDNNELKIIICNPCGNLWHVLKLSDIESILMKGRFLELYGSILPPA